MRQGLLIHSQVLENARDNIITNVEPSADLADSCVDYLAQLGVEAVFGVPGGAIEPLYNALARSQRRHGVKAVVARHESGAAFMAQGYARETGKPGVCCTTTGPGATNVLTAVASAYWDETPLLVITGQTPAANIARGALQDSSNSGVDTLSLFQNCTRYNALVAEPAQFERLFVQALQSMYGDPPGPVHLSIAPDVFRRKIPHSIRLDMQRHVRRARVIDIAQVNVLADEIAKASRPVILIGEFCQRGVCEIVAVAERLNIQFATTPGAKGLVASAHPLYVGVFGFAGHAAAREALVNPQVDLAIAVGTRLGEWDTMGWDEAALLNNKLIHVDQYCVHFSYSPMARMQVFGDIAAIFSALSARFSTPAPQSGRLSNVFDQPKVAARLHFPAPTAGVSPIAVMQWLKNTMSADTCVYVDAGNSSCWGVHYLDSFGPNTHIPEGQDWFRMSTQFASMGWGIGNAIGAAYGNRGRLFVCVTGDGSWLMNGQEFTVAVAEQLPMLFIILNDQAYGMVKHGQRMANAEPIAFELPKVDFCLMAQAMGGTARRVNNLQELYAITPEIINFDGPVVVDIIIDGEAVPPMQTRVKVLEAAL